jgi:hypothetical protein
MEQFYGDADRPIVIPCNFQGWGLGYRLAFFRPLAFDRFSFADGSATLRMKRGELIH